MATYDLIRIDWNKGTCNLINADGSLNIYYGGGFNNTLFFPDNLKAPQYEIEDDVKKVSGANLAKSQTWAKRLTLEIKHIESIADTLSLLPLHDTVIVTDKDGTAYVCNGPDVTVDIQPEGEGEALPDRNKYPLLTISITFNAHQIISTACCSTATTVVECSATLPTISDTTEIGAGTVLIEGTAPANHNVRLFAREYLEKVIVGNGIKINDVCFVTDTIAYCCSNLGGIYKTTDGGNTWIIKYPGSTQLNGICFDGVDKIWAVGDVVAGAAISVVATVGTDNFATVATGIAQNLNAVAFAAADNGFACGVNGVVMRYNGAAWVDVSPGTVTVLRDVATATGGVFVVGTNYVFHTDDNGTTWTTTNYAANDFLSCCSPDQASPEKWYAGNANGDVKFTDDKGATLTTELSGVGAVYGLTFADGVVFALDTNGQVYFDVYHNTLWDGLYKIKSTTTAKRIRANGATPVLMVAIGTGGIVATTQTALDEIESITASDYNGNGFTYTGVNNVSYQFQVQTFLMQTDPCQSSTITLFNT